MPPITDAPKCRPPARGELGVAKKVSSSAFLPRQLPPTARLGSISGGISSRCTARDHAADLQKRCDRQRDAMSPLTQPLPTTRLPTAAELPGGSR